MRRLLRPGTFLAKRTPREQGLAAAILAVLAIAWAMSLAKDFRSARERLATDATLRAGQEAWLALAPAMDAAIKARETVLKTSRSLDAEPVLGRIEQLLRQAGLSAETARPASHEHGFYRDHVVTLRAHDATLAQIVAFRRALDASGLPMALTSFELETSGTDGTLTARLDVTALQIP